MLKELEKWKKNVFYFLSPYITEGGAAIVFSAAGCSGEIHTAWDWKVFTLN